MDPEDEPPKPKPGDEKHYKWLQEFEMSMQAQKLHLKDVRVQFWYEGACVTWEKKYRSCKDCLEGIDTLSRPVAALIQGAPKEEAAALTRGLVADLDEYVEALSWQEPHGKLTAEQEQAWMTSVASLVRLGLLRLGLIPSHRGFLLLTC